MGSQSNLIRQDVYKKPPQPQIFNANTRAAIAGTVINSLPSVFMTLAQKVNSNTTKSQEPENTNRAPEDIQDDIIKILNSFGAEGCSSISEAETYYETQQAEAQKLAANLKTLETDKKSLDCTLSETNNQIKSLQTSIGADEALLSQIEDKSSDVYNTVQQRINDNKKKLEELNKKATDTTNLIKKFDEHIIDTKNAIKNSEDNLNDMKVKLDNLHKLEAQLKKAEAETTLAKYQQQDCEDVTLILQKLNNAKAKGKTDDVQKYEKELKTMLGKLNDNGKLTNGTLKNLAKFYGISVQD